jgi:hypothetical protein
MFAGDRGVETGLRPGHWSFARWARVIGSFRDVPALFRDETLLRRPGNLPGRNGKNGREDFPSYKWMLSAPAA